MSVRVRPPAPKKGASVNHDSCIFCSIIQKKIPATIITQTDDIIVIKDIAPKAPLHYLIIPKKHVADIQSLDEQDLLLSGHLLMMAHHLSKNIEGGFRLVINSGASAGQMVLHIHMHLLAGKQFEF